MEILQIIGIGLISLIIVVILRQYRPEYTIYVSIIAGVLILMFVMDKLTGIVSLLSNLADKGNVNKEFMLILLKITGITLLTEFAVSICKDAGESSIANKIDVGGKVVVIAISIPIISVVLETVLKILP